MTLEELNPELFTWELYNMAGLHLLDDALYGAKAFGYCDASRLPVRPRRDLYALMVEWPNGEKFWCHIDKTMLASIKRRLAQRI